MYDVFECVNRYVRWAEIAYSSLLLENRKKYQVFRQIEELVEVRIEMKYVSTYELCATGGVTYSLEESSYKLFHYTSLFLENNQIHKTSLELTHSNEIKSKKRNEWFSNLYLFFSYGCYDAYCATLGSNNILHSL